MKNLDIGKCSVPTAVVPPSGATKRSSTESTPHKMHTRKSSRPQKRLFEEPPIATDITPANKKTKVAASGSPSVPKVVESTKTSMTVANVSQDSTLVESKSSTVACDVNKTVAVGDAKLPEFDDQDFNTETKQYINQQQRVAKVATGGPGLSLQQVIKQKKDEKKQAKKCAAQFASTSAKPSPVKKSDDKDKATKSADQRGSDSPKAEPKKSSDSRRSTSRNDSRPDSKNGKKPTSLVPSRPKIQLIRSPNLDSAGTSSTPSSTSGPSSSGPSSSRGPCSDLAPRSSTSRASSDSSNNSQSRFGAAAGVRFSARDGTVKVRDDVYRDLRSRHDTRPVQQRTTNRSSLHQQ